MGAREEKEEEEEEEEDAAAREEERGAGVYMYTGRWMRVPVLEEANVGAVGEDTKPSRSGVSPRIAPTFRVERRRRRRWAWGRACVVRGRDFGDSVSIASQRGGKRKWDFYAAKYIKISLRSGSIDACDGYIGCSACLAVLGF
jgi:hypothetical protein